MVVLGCGVYACSLMFVLLFVYYVAWFMVANILCSFGFTYLDLD